MPRPPKKHAPAQALGGSLVGWRAVEDTGLTWEVEVASVAHYAATGDGYAYAPEKSLRFAVVLWIDPATVSEARKDRGASLRGVRIRAGAHLINEESSAEEAALLARRMTELGDWRDLTIRPARAYRVAAEAIKEGA